MSRPLLQHPEVDILLLSVHALRLFRANLSHLLEPVSPLELHHWLAVRNTQLISVLAVQGLGIGYDGLIPSTLSHTLPEVWLLLGGTLAYEVSRKLCNPSDYALIVYIGHHGNRVRQARKIFRSCLSAYPTACSELLIGQEFH